MIKREVSFALDIGNYLKICFIAMCKHVDKDFIFNEAVKYYLGNHISKDKTDLDGGGPVQFRKEK